MTEEQEQAKLDAALNAGVPLGGVGAGCIEMGRDGRFRNITINNNRTVDSRIPVSRGGLVAVRAARRGRVAARILQADSDIPLEEAGIRAPFTPVEQLSWRGLYPRADYRLDDPHFPVAVTWFALSPVIPYDLDFSCLPALFLSLEVNNPGDTIVDVATVLNWENLCGCTRSHWPLDRGIVQYVSADVTRERSRGSERAGNNVPLRLAAGGLRFGLFREYPTNAHGNYCLAARAEPDLTISVKSWDETKTDQVAEFWYQFHDEGKLDNHLAGSTEAHSVSVCCSFSLLPGTSRTVLYVFAWYCPQFMVGGYDQSNRYAITYESAEAVVHHSLKHHRYCLQAVDNWHRRFLSSSLPPWFSRMLINNSYVFSTNTLLTRDGKFAMFETPETPWAGGLDRRFHSSLGTLLFFPQLALNELGLFAEAEPAGEPGRLYRHLGRLCVHEPCFGEAKGELMDLNAKFILMVYRDYHLTGRLADLRKLFPRLGRVLRYILGRDHNRDGLPEGRGFSTTYDHWKFYGVDSYSATIWLAAIRAFAELARELNLEQETVWAEELLSRAQASVERRLWNATGGYYYFHDNAESEPQPDEPVQHGCASGQLAGQWYADFLGLGCLFPPDHIRRALEAIFASHERGKSITSWPALHVTHYACLEICHGDPDRGFHSVQKTFQTIHVKHGRTFNQPLCWNLNTDSPDGWGTDRHMSSPSVWHVLYAIEGFLLNVPQQQLWLRPHLPKGVHFLSAPLFSPVTFGWLTFRETDEKGVYRQNVHVSFDSPVQIQTVILRVPGPVEEVAIKSEGPEGFGILAHNFGYHGHERLLELQLKQPVALTTPLLISIEQTAGKKVSLPRH